MALEASSRVSVVRHNQVEPLVPGTPRFASDASPWQGIVVERHTVGSLEIPQHEHHSFCLHAQLSGTVEMEWWCEGKHGLERPTPGSLILLSAGTSDRLRWEGTSERLIVSIDESVMQRAGEEAGLPKVPSFANQWLLRDEALRMVLLEMGRETEAGWVSGALYGDLLGLSLAQLMLRRHGSAPVKVKDLRGGIPLPRLRRVLEYVETNLASDLRLEQLAAEAGLSAFHFARLFRESTSATPHQYVLDQRIRRAKDLMRLGRLPISEVAQETGFSSSANFARSFRSRVGVTPGEWKAEATR